MKALFILNDAPYGSEKTYNALRLAIALRKEHPDTDIRVFLLADAVTSVVPAQETPPGYYNIARMLKSVISTGGQVKLCGTCCEARGINAMARLEGAELGNLSQLAKWSVESDKVFVF